MNQRLTTLHKKRIHSSRQKHHAENNPLYFKARISHCVNYKNRRLMMRQGNLSNHNKLISNFMAFYKEIPSTPLDDIQQIYTDDIHFKDPLHEIRGIAELRHYLDTMITNVSHGHFEYLDQIVAPNCAYLKWNMHFTHPKLGNKNISVRGMTQILFEDKIYYHEDSYDVGAMIYSHIPVIKYVVRHIKNRLSRV